MAKAMIMLVVLLVAAPAHGWWQPARQEVTAPFRPLAHADEQARQATWSAFKDAIRRGDDVAAKAQFSVDPNAQEFVTELLGNLTAGDRANIDAILPSIEFVTSYGDPAFTLFAEYSADKVPAGVPNSHPVTFVRDPDGVWRIYTF